MDVPAAVAARHAAKVARIALQLRRHPGDRPLSIRKAGVSHQVPKAKDLRRNDDKIDLTALTEILHIDPVRRLCVAESGVGDAVARQEKIDITLLPLSLSTRGQGRVGILHPPKSR